MRIVLALLLIPALAFAQETPTCRDPEDPRCREEPLQTFVDPVPRQVVAPRAPGPSSSSLPTPSGSPPADAPLKTVPNAGGIGGGGEAALLVAVVLVALLPIIIYAVDEDAPPDVLNRFSGFGADVRLLGGGTWTPPEVGGQSFLAGHYGARASLGYSYFGADLGFRHAPAAGAQWDMHFLVRIKPRAHVSGALALGYRSVDYHGTRVHGFEAALPHEYTFWRNGPIQRFGLELRPAILVGPPYTDLRLDGAFVLSLSGPLTARIGGNVYSFGHEVRAGFEAGLVAEL
ncbi:MAG: hypothetical protein IT380_16640 [Myxococcales bacterium]|nr:hypothetical protein [Myxococcales bacterium]